MWERIAAHPELRKHLADPGYKAALEAVRAEHATLPKALDDPRVMQTLLALQGMGAMTYTDEDMRRALLCFLQENEILLSWN